MINKIISEHKPQGKIVRHRQEYIDTSLKRFIKEYNIKKWPVDCFSLISTIAEKGRIKLWFKTSDTLKEQEYVKTIYIPVFDRYLMVINQEKLRHPFKSKVYQCLNSALALELAHIILRHSDLPFICKDELQRELESLEAEDFVDKLLTPKGRTGDAESGDDEPYYIKPLPNNTNNRKYRLSEILFQKHYDDTLILKLKDSYMKVLFFLYCLMVLETYING